MKQSLSAVRLLCQDLVFVMDEFNTAGSGINQRMTKDLDISTYISLGFQLMMTIMISLMSGYVVFTIKATRDLHKTHNMFIANLMVAGIVGAVLQTSFSIVTVIYFFAGVENLPDCNIKQFLLFPIMTINFSAVMLTVDKVVVIEFPFKHRKIMTHRTVGISIIATWLLAILLSTERFTIHYDNLADYDLCASLVVANRSNNFIFRIFPLAVSSLLTISLNVYLAYKAYQTHKQIKRETRLSGTTNEIVTLKKKLAKLKKDMKPIVTLLMTLFGSSLLAKLFISMLNLSTPLFSDRAIMEVDQVLSSNVMFIVFFIHPIVFGFYFKQIRTPMVKKLKSLICRNKAVVVPMPLQQRRT